MIIIFCKNEVIRSVIDLGRRTFPDHFSPFFLSRTYTLSFPFYFCFISWRSWPYLFYLLFVWSNIRKSCITTKTIFYLFWFFILSLESFKRTIRTINWSIRGRRWQFRFSFVYYFIKFIMFFRPIFVISNTLLYMLNFIVRAVETRTWNFFTQKMSIFMEKSFLTLFKFNLSKLFSLLKLLFNRFL